MLSKIIGSIWDKIPEPLRLRLIRATQKKFTASAGAVIVDENKKVLLLEHEMRPGPRWGIPGGFLEYGEQAIEALRRELLEEIDLELKNIRLLHVKIVGRHIEFFFFAEANGAAEIKSREIRALEWFAADELPEELLLSQKKIIGKVLSEEI